MGSNEAEESMETDITKELRRVSIDVMEVHSPQRVTAEGARMGLSVGEAMDLTTGWDFTRAEDRQKALQ